jgi:hypothetical protein
MNPIRLWAVITVTLALALYSVGTLKAQRARRSTDGVRGFLSAGLTLDVIATALMIAATGAIAPTLHGWLGYTALAFMAADVWLMWRHARRRRDEPLPHGLRLYARLAYSYWVLAYVAGAALVMAERKSH